MMFYNFKEVIPRSQIGVKSFYFKQLQDKGFSLPNGFVVTKEFFKRLLIFNDVEDDFNTMISNLRTNFNVKILDNIKRLILNLNIPADLSEQFNKEYVKLSYNAEEVKSAFDLISSPTVVMRASDENKKLDTFTNIKDKTELLKALKSCWQSYFNEDTFSENNSMSLIVQKMIKTDKSGWVEIHDEVQIKSFWGQAGFMKKSNPDKIIIDKGITKVISREKGEQTKAYVLDKNSYAEKLIPENLRGRYVLDDKELNQIVDLIKKMDYEDFSFEFGFSKNKIYILNLRIVETKEETKKLDENQGSILDMYEPANENTNELDSNFNKIININDEVSEKEVEDFHEKAEDNDALINDSNIGIQDYKEVNNNFNVQDFQGDVDLNVEKHKVVDNLKDYNTNDVENTNVENQDQGNDIDFIEKVSRSEVKDDTVERKIDATIEKYITINPTLENVLLLLKTDLINELK